MLFHRFLRILKSNLLTQNTQVPLDKKHNTHAGNGHQQQSNGSTASFTTQERAYYQALEVSPGVSFDEIKAAYKQQIRKYHPDLFHTHAEKRRYAEIVTQKLNEAYAYFEKKFTAS
jgi:DnaJ-domain-containing protein 1